MGSYDLVVRGRIGSRDARLRVHGGGLRGRCGLGRAALDDAQLRALVGSQAGEMTFTAVPSGTGLPIGVDGDRYADGDKFADGSDASNPLTTP